MKIISINVYKFIAFISLFVVWINASASSVVYEEVLLMHGNPGGIEKSTVDSSLSSPMVHLFSFDLDSPGEYKVTLTDYDFPDPFTGIELSIGVRDGENIAQIDALKLSGEGSLQFSNTGPETYYATVFGYPTGSYDFGLYGVQVLDLSNNPVGGTAGVPVPPAVVLLGSALGAFMLVRRKKIA